MPVRVHMRALLLLPWQLQNQHMKLQDQVCLSTELHTKKHTALRHPLARTQLQATHMLQAQHAGAGAAMCSSSGVCSNYVHAGAGMEVVSGVVQACRRSLNHYLYTPTDSVTEQLQANHML